MRAFWWPAESGHIFQRHRFAGKNFVKPLAVESLPDDPG
jgi:hypothetical protein